MMGTKPDSERQLRIRYDAVEYITSTFRGLPYLWAGDDPIAGFDCSGLIMEMLQSRGIYGRHEDRTAEGIWQDHKHNEISSPYNPYIGCLVFWFSPEDGRAKHVAVVKNDLGIIIHAAGGGGATRTRGDAIRQNAYIREDSLCAEIDRRLNAYGQHYKIVDPWRG